MIFSYSSREKIRFGFAGVALDTQRLGWLSPGVSISL